MFYNIQNQMTPPNRVLGCELGEYCKAEGLDQLYVLSDIRSRRKERKQKRAWLVKISMFRRRIEYSLSK